MNTAVVYIHGKGGNAAEAEHYKSLFPDCEVAGFDYRAETPWEAKCEFSEYFSRLSEKYDDIMIIANSIGAFFTLYADMGSKVTKAYFISPVVNMEKLITDRMIQAGVTEKELEEKKEIQTAFRETLSWKYLCYVREKTIVWNTPTLILYGEKDSLTSLETITAFAEKTGAAVTVMKGGEHWFHTQEQMEYLDEWLKTH